MTQHEIVIHHERAMAFVCQVHTNPSLETDGCVERPDLDPKRWRRMFFTMLWSELMPALNAIMRLDQGNIRDHLVAQHELILQAANATVERYL